MAIEIVERRVAQEVWPGMWRAETTFAEDEDLAAASASGLWDSTFPGWDKAAEDPPEFMGSEIVYRPGGVKGIAAIFARYETPGVGKAKVYVEHSVGAGVRIRKYACYDPEHNHCPGCESPIHWFEGFPDQWHEWRTLMGNPVIYEAGARLRVDTTYKAGEFPLTAFLTARNHLNETDLTVLLGDIGLPDGLLLVAAMPRGNRGQYEDVSFILERAGGYGNTKVMTQIGAWFVTKEPVIDEEGNAIEGQFRAVYGYHPGYVRNPVTKKFEFTGQPHVVTIREPAAMTFLSDLEKW